MNNIMLDLETMGNGPNAAIIAIGAVFFDYENEQLGESFYETISLQSSVNGGGEIDASTVIWWLQQTDSARKAVTTGQEPMQFVLELFSEWIAKNQDGEPVKMWGNGAAFDNVILALAYNRHHIPQPWHYQNDRCYRTLKALFPQIEYKQTGTKHIAIDDAINQAAHLIEILNFW